MILKENLLDKVTDAQKVVNLIRSILATESEIDQDKEHFWTIGLSAQLQIKYIDLVSLGILNQCNIHPRETFRLAILKGISKIIIAHNHPSGAINPSEEDLAITERLKAAGKIIGIELLDHIIITKDGFHSFNEMGIL
jgi:DNA repair protein RadC